MPEKGVFDESVVGVTCPKCAYKTDAAVEHIRARQPVVCAHCGETFTPELPDLSRPASEVDRTVDALRAMLRGRR